MQFSDIIIAAAFGTIPLLFMGNYFFVLTIIPVFFARWYMINYFVKWIGGYTGDCLGAVQQVTEVVFYICVGLITWKFI